MKRLFDNKTTDVWTKPEHNQTMITLNGSAEVHSYSKHVYEAIDRISVISFSDLRGTIVHVNENFEKISGYGNAELAGKNYNILNSAYHSKNFWRDMYDALSKGITWHQEIKNKAKDGSYFWLDTSIIPLFDDDGNVIEYMSMQNDITARKNAEARFTNQTDITEFAIDAAEIGIWEWHIETKEFTCNDYMRKHYGWSGQAIIKGEDLTSRIHPSDTFKFNLMQDETLAGKSVYKSEYRIILDDDVHYLSTKGVVIRDHRGTPIKVIGVSINITDLKKNAEVLKRQQELLDLAIEAGEIGVYSWTGEDGKAITNKYMDQHFGMQFGTIKFNEFLEFVHPDDQERLQAALQDTFLNQKKFDIEYRIVKDGRENHIAAKGNVICDENKKVKEMVGIVLNITKQKVLEEELKTKHEMLNMAIDAGEIGVFDWEVETRKTVWNSFMHQHIGLPVEEFDGTDASFSRRLHPDDRELVEQAVRQSIQTGEPVDIEYRAMLSNNTINYIKCRGILIHDAHKKPKRIVGAIINITKLKQTEEELKTKQNVLNLAIEAGEIGVFSWDVKRGVLTGNKYINQHYGFDDDKTQFTFDEFKNILHPNDVQKITDVIENNFQGKAKYEIDYRTILNDNRVHYLSSFGILSNDTEGSAEHLVGIVLNVTKQKELEVTLRESEKKFRSAMQDSEIGMAILSVDGWCLEVNKALLDILGYEEEELLKLNVHAITHPDDLEKSLLHGQQLISREIRSYTTEKRYVRKDGGVIWGQLNRSLIRNDAGEPLYFVAQIQDITLRKQIDKKLQEHNQKLEAANNELESFSYSVSHDLRAPLRIINGYVEILKEDFGTGISDESKQVMETIIYNANKMGQLIDNLLEFSKMSRKGIEKNFIEIDSMVRGIISELKGFEIDRQIDIKIGYLPAIYADADMFKQVWLNLIQNAIKYTRKKPLAHIEIDSYREAENTCFFIRDNGVGFNMKYIHKLFEVFQRLHSIVDFEGTGVGLAIVKRIIERHGGRIWVDAKENEGATFYFSIPDHREGSIF